MLTNTEQRIYDYIHSHWLRVQQTPTITEISRALKISSRGTIHRYISSLIEKGWLKRTGSGWRNLELADQPTLTLPMLGLIAAGQPIQALPGIDILNITEMFLGEDRFALKVSGDSMIDVGIFDGDWVIIKRQQTASNGNIVVALIDDNEATLKRFYLCDKNIIELRPENKAMQAIRYEAHRVKIQGIILRTIRDFVSQRKH